MISNKPILFISALILIIYSQAQAKPRGVTFDVVQLGAKPDGKTDSSKAFMDAWKAACGSVVSASIYVPPGRFLINGLFFGDRCENKNNVLFRIDGVLVAPEDFQVTGTAANWIEFREVDGVTISGGILDGQGIGLWDCKLAGESCPPGATVSNYVYESKFIIFMTGPTYTKISTNKNL